MKALSDLQRDAKFLTGALSLLKWTKDISPEMDFLTPDDFERAVDEHEIRVAFRFDGKLMTYGAFDKLANRYAHWALQRGLKPGDVVALLMENRPDYVAAWVGLSKVGVVAALVNTNLEGEALAFSLNIVGTKKIITGAGFDAAIRSAQPYLEGQPEVWSLRSRDARNLVAELNDMPVHRPSRLRRAGLKGRDTCLYVYTSGTTGLPKAAKLTHARVRTLMRNFIGPCRVTPRDRIYETLPLYHATGGVCAVGAALMSGASLVLARKFSSSRFWDEAVEQGATLFVYIGEVCRYLLNQPAHPLERVHSIRGGFGNGLREDVWARFADRFGISDFKEFYGSTEGNVSLLNIDGKVGACGRIPPWMSKPFNHVAFVKSDVVTEQPVRGADGFCVRADTDEVGEVLGRIGEDNRTRFEGYTDKRDTEGKVLFDVFEKGDMWFRTGDLMRKDKDGYVYFVDRIGDTFRWKGENVATNEVGEAFSRIDGVETANVYGIPVPGADGKAGMAAITASKELDIAGLHRLLAERLPGYAIPIFLRVQKEPETTGTFKYRKVELVKEGFDPDKVHDPLYVYNAEEDRYEPLTGEVYRKVVAGGGRF
ncbi:MAG TPA: long-chain-acyl-CoA synthetase [Hyphomonas sp.]|nr:long-chain-acyl-CoA synthetase [Hyphomonas sp.]